MRSGSSTVSDEEEQVVGSPMAQVTANMPPLRPGQDLPLRPILIAVFVFLCSPPLCRTFDSGQCTAALGMENGEIPDEDISASSMYDPSLGPKHARLRQDKGGGAWCPKNMVTKEGKEYLEVNLHSPRALTSTRTQGRFGNGHGVEYTEEYFVEYWRPGFNKWVRWRNRRGMELLAGNNNPYSEKEQLFDPAIVATKIRFIPYTSHMRMVCIRVELYGCPWTGYEWVGWRNDTPSMLGRPVEITFEFDYSRNFTAIHLHMNNYFTKDVQVFSYAKVYLGAGGNQFNGEPVHFSYIPDLVLEQARDVTIKLHSRAGRFLKLQLYFAARWIMLSEVIFESVISEWNNTDDEEPRNKSAIVSATGIPYQNNEGPLQRDEVKATFNKEENNDNALPDKSKEPESRQFVGLVIGILTTVIVMLLAAITFIFYRNRRLKAALAPSTFYDQHGDLKVSVQEEGEDKGPICPPLPAQYHPAAYATTTPQLHKTITDYSRMTEVQPVIPLLLNTAINLARPIPSVQEYSSNPPPIPPPPEKYYASTEICKNSLPPLPPSPTPSTPPPMSAKASSSMTSYSPEDMLTEEEDEVAECILDFPREKLNIVENLGCGYFGDVHICEVDRFPGYDEVFRNTTSDLVIVKSLRPGSSDALRIEFQEEAKRLARLADRNVARLLGASLGDDPMCIVLENGEYGDLNQYLQRHIAETSTVHTAKTLSFGTLIYMATQIASGMKHLEEMDLVHRDLATRNCLVSRGYTVKVCDLGSGRNAYAADYFRVEGRPPLPIRWMAWEAMLMGRHTSKSDVWSFAVTLWEILTFAREQPFEELPDHRIVENATYFYQEDDRRIILPLPKNCPKDIYELMRECWHRNDVDRPSFREIHMFLQRKNLGYKHADTNDT
ncbi:discoidin domain-containing receptor 2-like isoform X1 [Apis florea]|uniref:discoidin domain-containing receptor 2-like isoform X1 n=1 Tax=Apis florea TaxID=7463 RepID=UPI000629C1D3|nr:discoidin domain-containing receptor 2-like isoform X1 [Apis florea]XP_012341147.1 discoidin domain-containing receptor 2-like isoform X1 [Apis florea]XP_012341149.1 discoidin domain-containing receptor 2-like isoform X1 [Apis florea]